MTTKKTATKTAKTKSTKRPKSTNVKHEEETEMLRNLKLNNERLEADNERSKYQLVDNKTEQARRNVEVLGRLMATPNQNLDHLKVEMTKVFLSNLAVLNVEDPSI